MNDFLTLMELRLFIVIALIFPPQGSFAQREKDLLNRGSFFFLPPRQKFYEFSTPLQGRGIFTVLF